MITAYHTTGNYFSMVDPSYFSSGLLGAGFYMTRRPIDVEDIMPEQMTLTANIDEDRLLVIGQNPLQEESIKRLKDALDLTFDDDVFTPLKSDILRWFDEEASSVAGSQVPYYKFNPSISRYLIEKDITELAHAQYYAAHYASALFHNARYKGLIEANGNNLIIFSPEDIPDLHLHCVGAGGGPISLPQGINIGDVVVPAVGGTADGTYKNSYSLTNGPCI